MYDCYVHFRSESAYVPQESVMAPTTTVHSADTKKENDTHVKVNFAQIIYTGYIICHEIYKISNMETKQVQS